VILVFFAIYSASGIVAGARLFENLFAVSYPTALVAGAAATILDTALRGFLAVRCTDTVQASLVIFALLIAPMVVLSLLWPRMTRNGALAGMLVGAAVVLVWKQYTPFGLYEMVPGCCWRRLRSWWSRGLVPRHRLPCGKPSLRCSRSTRLPTAESLSRQEVARTHAVAVPLCRIPSQAGARDATAQRRG